MRIGVFGSGYVGIVSAVCLAELGNHVHCVDVDAAKIEMLRRAECPIYEPALLPMLKENLEAGRIVFSTNAIEAIEHAEVIFIAVGTPSQADGAVDLSYVEAVAHQIGQHLTRYTVIVNKSTVAVGTADKVRAIIESELKRRQLAVEFDVVSNPEFLKEGDAVEDFMRADRIIIGSESARAIQMMKTLYAPINRNYDKVMVMKVRSAELTKYAANAMLATKISFMNEMSRIAESVGADIEEVRVGMGSDQRIGYSFIYPGCGYGGSCFPKDVLAIQKTADLHGVDAKILKAVHQVNSEQKQVLLQKIEKHYGGKIKGKVFGLWGLSFKPNTDDVREAPSRVVLEGLWAQGARVKAFDPQAMQAIAKIYGNRPDFTLCPHAEDALEGIDALIIVTEWMQFRSPDFLLFAEKIKDKVIFDGRNLYDAQYLKTLGLKYYAIGRP